MFQTMNLLWVIFCGSILISVILFLLYLRWIVKSYIAKQRGAILSSTTSPVASEMFNNPPISTTDVDYETETTSLMIPQQNSRWSKSMEKEGSDFFRLPIDRPASNPTYYKFGLVDDIKTNEITEYYQSRPSRSVAHFGRKGCRLYRKGTWDRAVVRIFVNNTDNRCIKREEKVVNPIVTFTPNNTQYYRIIMQNEVVDFQPTVGDSNKEVLI